MSEVRIERALTPEAFAQARSIIQEYGDSLGVSPCVLGLDKELDALAQTYSQSRAALLLALVDGALAGCCALAPIDDVDYANAAEMKRLYVRPAFRGFGLGRQLAESVLDFAHQEGYSCVLLDTLDEMETARSLYEELGFVEIPPYYHTPIAGAHYLMCEL